MRDIAALELGVVVAELKPRISNSFMKKFYDLGNDSFRLSFHGSNGNVEVYFKLLVTLNETKFKEEVGGATNFAIAVRKRIEDSKLIDIYQHKSDRIVIFEFGTREGRYKLILEMFGKGNLILLDDSGKIELCYKLISYKDRTIRPGFDYVFPNSESLELNRLNKDELEKLFLEISGSQNKMIVEISKFINLGPIYLDSIIREAGLDPRSRLKESEVHILSDAFAKFLEIVSYAKPTAYFENGTAVDYSLMPLKKYSGLENKEFNSFSELLDELNIESRHSKDNKEINKDLEELDANIGKQKVLVKQFNDEAQESEIVAKKIFENMNELNSVIYYLQQNKRATIEELKKEFPHLKIDKLNLKDKKVIIEM